MPLRSHCGGEDRGVSKKLSCRGPWNTGGGLPNFSWCSSASVGGGALPETSRMTRVQPDNRVGREARKKQQITESPQMKAWQLWVSAEVPVWLDRGVRVREW